MSDGSTIEWLQRPGTKPASWNPIVAWRDVPQPDGSVKRLRGWHCEHVHGGCEWCYAEGFNGRLGTRLAYKPGLRKHISIELHEPTLLQPLKWRQPRTIFVCSMTDLYGSWVKDEWLDKIKAVQALTPQHTYIELTKRPERMREYLSAPGRATDINFQMDVITGPSIHWEDMPLPNVWGLVSCSTQEDADNFGPHLKVTPLAVRGMSAEPLLGPITLPSELDWVIVGGESGPNARPMHPDWARSIRDQCEAAGVPFFFKQWGQHAPSCYPANEPPDVVHVRMDGSVQEFPIIDSFSMRPIGKKSAGRSLDGKEHSEFPSSSVNVDSDLLRPLTRKEEASA